MKEPYVKINVILGSVLILIFSYSFFYPWLASRGATVPSSCAGMPEAYCKSRGLSRAFASIMHGQAEQAKKLNAWSISIFTFFALQLPARIFFSFLFLRFRKEGIIYFDAIGSAGYFVVTFLPIIKI